MLQPFFLLPLLLGSSAAHAAATVKLTIVDDTGGRDPVAAAKKPALKEIPGNRFRELSVAVAVSSGTFAGVLPKPEANSRYQVCVFFTIRRDDMAGKNHGTCVEGNDLMGKSGTASDLAQLPANFVAEIRNGDTVDAWAEYYEGIPDGTFTPTRNGKMIANYRWVPKGPEKLATGSWKVTVPKVVAPPLDQVTAMVTEGLEAEKASYGRSGGVNGEWGEWSVTGMAQTYGPKSSTQRTESLESRHWNEPNKFSYSDVVVGEPERCAATGGPQTTCYWPVSARLDVGVTVYTSRPIIAPRVDMEVVSMACTWATKIAFDKSLALSDLQYWSNPTCTKVEP